MKNLLVRYLLLHTLVMGLVAILSISPAFAQSQYSSVYLEDFTWPEIRDKMHAGFSTIIIPTGGTEQNGPHLAIGKHNVIVSFTAGEIARDLGRTLVAPVIAYVPEGRISPPEGHMKFPGTISVSEDTLARMLEDAARSMKEHGFMTICFIGDHGGSQAPQAKVAAKLTAEWRSEGVQVIQVSDYYASNGQEAWSMLQHKNVKNPAGHGGFFDTSELLATDKRLVREALIRGYSEADYAALGVASNPEGASETLGAQLLKLKVDAAVEQIQGALAH